VGPIGFAAATSDGCAIVGGETVGCMTGDCVGEATGPLVGILVINGVPMGLLPVGDDTVVGLVTVDKRKCKKRSHDPCRLQNVRRFMSLTIRSINTEAILFRQVILPSLPCCDSPFIPPRFKVVYLYVVLRFGCLGGTV